jgi:Zn-dependent protease
LLSSDFVIRIYEFVILIFSLCVHESAHAWMASRLGDQTSRMLGRISLNPVAHIDPIGTLLFPAIGIFGPLIGLGGFGRFMIGWAKPVMINPRNFRKIVRDDNLVSLAGPASNLLIALCAVLLLVGIELMVPQGKLLVFYTMQGGFAPTSQVGVLVQVAFLTILVNLSLCFFNLVPIPPLDGSHVLRNMLPYNAARVFDRFGGILSYVAIWIFGRFLVGLLMGPALMMIFTLLSVIHGPTPVLPAGTLQ